MAPKNKQTNLNKIICYNCNNKGYYLNTYPNPPKAKKLVLVLASSTSVSNPSMEAKEVILKQELCNQYPVKFRKNKETVQALINSDSKVNAMTLAYAAVLGLKVCSIAVEALKIDGSFFMTFSMVIASF